MHVIGVDDGYGFFGGQGLRCKGEREPKNNNDVVPLRN